MEESSFGQMKNINKYGSYTIGTNAPIVETRLANVIKLRLKTRGKSVQQSSYTLDELRDLESKLVLITGKDSKEKEEVYLFSNVSGMFVMEIWYRMHRIMLFSFSTRHSIWFAESQNHC